MTTPNRIAQLAHLFVTQRPPEAGELILCPHHKWMMTSEDESELFAWVRENGPVALSATGVSIHEAREIDAAAWAGVP